MTRNITPPLVPQGTAPQNLVSVGPELAASVKQFDLAAGLYAVTIGDAGDHRRTAEGLTLPITQLRVVGRGTTGEVDIFAAGMDPGWAGPQGGTIVLRISTPRGRVLLTTYRPADQPAVPLSIQVAPLGRPASLEDTTYNEKGDSDVGAASHSIHSEPAPAPRIRITLACRGTGESSAEGDMWAGSPGEGQLIEAFGLRLLDESESGDIEYKAFGPNGIETPWVRDARLCGSRGRGVSLTGFAIRLTGALHERYQLLYQGAFTESGESAEHRDGEACRGLDGNDLLEGLRIRLEARN